MGLKEQKTAENKEKLQNLPERIKDVEMKTSNGDFNVDVIKKILTNSQGQEKIILTVDHEEFPESKNIIRMYLPLMGAAGHVPSEEDIRKLFGGETIKASCVSLSKGTEYKPNISFSPLAEHEFKGKVIYYGDTTMSFD